MKSRNILVVDDEKDLVELVTYNLRKEGFSADSAFDGETALEMIKKGGYHLLILDLMLPGIQGLELCRIIRNNPETSHLPVIILTARGEEVDRILGLEMGADDYITKPFSPRELIARVKAVLRRAEVVTSPPPEINVAERGIIRAGDLEIDRDRYKVRIKGREVHLSTTEFKLLNYLAERRGRIFTREELLDAIWGTDVAVEPRTVDVHIRRLRSQIEEDPSRPRYIKTRRGAGYYFSEE